LDTPSYLTKNIMAKRKSYVAPYYAVFYT